jgi:Holliday junction DNA helicase RuvB
LRFNYYSADEMVKLIDQRARLLHWEVAPEVLPLLAGRGRGVPRVGLRLLEACRRTARAEGATTITPQHFERTMRLEGIDHLGLDELERRYLTYLAEAGSAVRVGVLAARLGLPMPTVSDVIEDYLIREGLVLRTECGRELTPRGLQHIRRGATAPADSQGA